jgi:hypothetical protein
VTEAEAEHIELTRVHPLLWYDGPVTAVVRAGDHVYFATLLGQPETRDRIYGLLRISEQDGRALLDSGMRVDATGGREERDELVAHSRRIISDHAGEMLLVWGEPLREMRCSPYAVSMDAHRAEVGCSLDEAVDEDRWRYWATTRRSVALEHRERELVRALSAAADGNALLEREPAWQLELFLDHLLSACDGPVRVNRGSTDGIVLVIATRPSPCELDLRGFLYWLDSGGVDPLWAELRIDSEGERLASYRIRLGVDGDRPAGESAIANAWHTGSLADDAVEWRFDLERRA